MNLHVFEYIIYLHNLVINLAVMLYGKILLIPRRNEPVDKKYRKLVVGTLPKIDTVEKLDYTKILQEGLDKTGKELKPVSRRKANASIDTSAICPRCNTPHQYVSKLNALTPKEKIRYKKDPQEFELRYIYRLFNIDFKPLSKDSEITTHVSLPKIRVSSHTLGLILTYYVS